ncbi:MAG: DUF2948 family protein [Alphaproteobacteria bacterium TMED89]|nr:hypothetical protein [Rhodospirillaceae bacterium]RPH20188.1 MAG: DUF2948 family protein [Alphaproteobacteria bacterium TMED89]
MASKQRVKLLGRETRDIVMLSGLVQDAIFVPAEMTIEDDKRRFIAMLNRFQWEHAATFDAQNSATPSEQADARFEDDVTSGYTRSFAALTVEGITGARTKSIKMGSRDQFVSIMALVPDEKGLTIVCSGEAAIRLSGANLRVYLEDLGEPWPTQCKPEHGDDLAEIASEAPTMSDGS